MSATFEDLREDFARTFEAIGHHTKAQQRLNEALMDENAKLWEDVSVLRDELHALANRVEALTRARLTEPAEVAEAMEWWHCPRCNDHEWSEAAAPRPLGIGTPRCPTCDWKMVRGRMAVDRG